MHSPICYAVIKQEGYEMPKLSDLRDEIPDEETIMSYLPEADWCVANVNDEDGWHRGVATPDDILEMLALGGLADVEFTDDTKQWIKMTITKDNAIDNLHHKLDIRRKYLDVVEKGLEHGVIANTLVGTKQHPDVFTEEDSQISYKHYSVTNTFGGLRIFAYERSEWADGALTMIDMLKDNTIIESIQRDLNKNGVYEMYVATGITGDYHF